MEVSKDELAKLMMVETELAKEIQELKRAWGPKPDRDKHKDKDKKGMGGWRQKGDAVNEVAAEEYSPTSDAPWLSSCSQGPQLGRSQGDAEINAAPSTSGIVHSPGYTPSGMPGTRPERKNSCNGWVRANAGGITTLAGPTRLTKVPTLPPSHPSRLKMHSTY